MQVLIVRAAMRLGHEHSDVLADNLGCGVAKDFLGGRIHGFDDAGGIDGNDALQYVGDDRTQALLALFDPLFSMLSQLSGPVLFDQRGAGVHVGRKRLDECLVVSVEPIRDAGHAHKPVSREQGQAEKAVERRVPRRQAAAAFVISGIIRNHRPAGSHGRPEQGIQIVEFQAPRRILFKEGTCRFIPGDIGNGMGAQIGRTVVPPCTAPHQ